MNFKHSFQGNFVKHSFVDDLLNLIHSEMHKKPHFETVNEVDKYKFL